MRVAIGMAGLLGLLITVGIVLMLMAGPIGAGGQSYLGAVADARSEATVQARQFSGKDSQGTRANESLTLAEAGDAFRVTAIAPGSELAAAYGLMVDDVITDIGPQPIGGAIISGEQVTRDFLDDAFARRFPITVRREGTSVTLDYGAGQAAAPPNPAAGGPAGAPNAPPAGNSLQRQLDQITRLR